MKLKIAYPDGSAVSVTVDHINEYNGIRFFVHKTLSVMIGERFRASEAITGYGIPHTTSDSVDECAVKAKSIIDIVGPTKFKEIISSKPELNL